MTSADADRIVQTHVSTLIFLGERAFKVKKPVRFGFVDLSSYRARSSACRDEVRLNSRLAPDVYEGVGSFRFPDGREEPVVVMKRLPPDRSLAALVRAEDPGAGGQVRRVARMLADFHRDAQRGPHIDTAAGPGAISALWAANLSETRAVAGSYLDQDELALADRMARRFIHGRAILFEERIDRRRIVDGHGDLLADDIFCVDDYPRIIDCLEFSNRLRWGDVVLDVAFLAMDLERLGRRELAYLLREEYRARSGDSWPETLMHFYIAYRALVRAKVACIEAASDSGRGRGGEVAAGVLQQICVEHLRKTAIRMVLVGGLPGAGKSTLAARLAALTGWPVLSTDAIRKAVPGLGGGGEGGDPWEQGMYSPGATARVYRELLDRASAHLARGQSVLLDGSWTRRDRRVAAAQRAAQGCADLVELRCDADPQLRERRILGRLALGHRQSDATPAIARRMAKGADPWPEAVTIDTSQALDATAQHALRAIGLSINETGDAVPSDAAEQDLRP